MATGRMQYLGDAPSSADDLVDKGYVDSQTAGMVTGLNGLTSVWLGKEANLPATGTVGVLYVTKP